MAKSRNSRNKTYTARMGAPLRPLEYLSDDALPKENIVTKRWDTGCYSFGLPPLSSAPKGSRIINPERATPNAVELRSADHKYLGLYDPMK